MDAKFDMLARNDVPLYHNGGKAMAVSFWVLLACMRFIAMLAFDAVYIFVYLLHDFRLSHCSICQSAWF